MDWVVVYCCCPVRIIVWQCNAVFYLSLHLPAAFVGSIKGQTGSYCWVFNRDCAQSHTVVRFSSHQCLAWELRKKLLLLGHTQHCWIGWPAKRQMHGNCIFSWSDHCRIQLLFHSWDTVCPNNVHTVINRSKLRCEIEINSQNWRLWWLFPCSLGVGGIWKHKGSSYMSFWKSIYEGFIGARTNRQKD